jgi:hypothetical protein
MRRALYSIACLLLILIAACKKEIKHNPPVLRTGTFLLYTDQNFSHESNNISFTAFIESPVNKIIWDTILPPMRISDIPDKAHQIKFEKTVLAGSRSLMKVGYRYAIENVGLSWYIDSSGPGQTSKVVDFNFR